MDNTKKTIELKNEIALFRRKLDSLLCDKKAMPDKILKLSQELDILIVQYYHAQIYKDNDQP